MRNTSLLTILLVSCLFSQAQSHTLEKLWTTDTLLKTPESVLWFAKNDFLYVSNIDGDPAKKDGKGSIAKISLDGKIINNHWVTGLEAPKGMGIYKNKLYVADLTDIVEIDIPEAKILKRIPVKDAVFLNDIAIDKKGVVYVSDTRTNKVHKLEKGFVATVLENLQGPNGLLCVDEDLLILDRGSLIRLMPNGNLGNITTGMDPSTDGIEQVAKDEYLVSAWNGVLYYIYANGEKQTLLDSRPQNAHTADIGYNPKKRILYVPTFYGNTVIAYQLK
ncbi:MAG: ATP/GTP-binding protein [Bacteroidota bacterium]|nr:ATP/GTP-binding protein [Bacteroidota bacterium]